jgi:hypothetical protein
MLAPASYCRRSHGLWMITTPGRSIPQTKHRARVQILVPLLLPIRAPGYSDSKMAFKISLRALISPALRGPSLTADDLARHCGTGVDCHLPGSAQPFAFALSLFHPKHNHDPFVKSNRRRHKYPPRGRLCGILCLLAGDRLPKAVDAPSSLPSSTSCLFFSPTPCLPPMCCPGCSRGWLRSSPSTRTRIGPLRLCRYQPITVSPPI